ncbi:MAG TPA: signal peptidase II [Burkholderiales bacterium]|nr:signal peptidase II [Burkholderiales bacterium]
MPRAAAWFALAAAVLVADRFSKLAMLEALVPGERFEVTGFFNLVLVFNRGAAFSFLADASGWQTLLFAAIAIGAALVVSWLILRTPERRLLCTGLALILGGAIGNLIDRLLYGHVVDFVDLHAFGWHWPAFNVADSGITVGAGLVILEGFLHRDAGEAAPRG